MMPLEEGEKEMQHRSERRAGGWRLIPIVKPGVGRIAMFIIRDPF